MASIALTVSVTLTMLSSAAACAWEAAVSEATRAVDVADQVGSDAARIWALQWLGIGLAQLGRVDEGLGQLDRSCREAVEHRLPVLAVKAICNGVQIRLRSLRLKEAMASLSTLESIAVGSAAVPIRALNQSAVFLAAGDAEAALSMQKKGC